MKTFKRLLKKSNQKTANHDINNRDKAITIIDGTIYEADTHARCINNFYDKNDLDDHYLASEFNRPARTKFVDSIAFAHLVQNENAIYLENNSLQNISLEEAANILKTNYSNYSIYNDDNKNPTMDFSTGKYISKYELITK